MVAAESPLLKSPLQEKAKIQLSQGGRPISTIGLPQRLEMIGAKK
jgi:hypothetical protein